jgi:hypothetical protein
MLNRLVYLESCYNFSDYYIYNVKWIDDSVVMVVYVNRKQTKTFYCIYNSLTGKITFHKVNDLIY